MYVEQPCTRDCPDRDPYCHSTCEKYLVYQKYREELREQKLKQKQLDRDYYATTGYKYRKKRRRPYADNRGGY